jgi:3-hydroxybutyryl-CoA dehydratase
MENQGVSRGLFFDEFKVGMRFSSAGRTITEGDVYLFAGLTGDNDPIHTDAEYSANFVFGQRVAHGLLGLSTAVGLAIRMGILEGTVIAFREIIDWKFSAPIFFGDTISVVMEVIETKAVPRMGGGLVMLHADIVNQEGKIVQHGRWSALVKDREGNTNPGE